MMHYELSGPADAPALVLSNSLGTSTRMWDAQAGLLSEHFRLVRYDHRGHGRSPVPDGPYLIEDLGHDLLGLLDHLQIDRASVCGVSLGGMVGMWLAANAPERVDRLVVCCTAAYLPPVDAWAERAAIVRRAGSTEVIADAVLGRWLTPEALERDRDTRSRLRTMLLATPADGYASCCAVIEHLDLRGSLTAIAAPTLAIAGAEDPATPPAHLEAITAAIPECRLEVLDGAAHLANIERAERFNELVADHCLGLTHA